MFKIFEGTPVGMMSKRAKFAVNKAACVGVIAEFLVDTGKSTMKLTKS